MPRRILVVGGGAREHALAWRLAGEHGVEAILCAPGNDAISTLPRVSCLAVRSSHGPEVAALASREDVDLAVIGPEAPLAAGVGDALRAAGVPTFGPSAAAARIETSKAFCREVAAAAGIRMARGAAFTDAGEARAFAAELARGGRGVVVKADGLMAGKGVFVCDDLAAAHAAIGALLGEIAAADAASVAVTAAAVPTAAEATPPSRPVIVVEERLTGREASVIAVCDGAIALPLPAARDHKRIGDGDTGPNTGGMGAYAPIPEMHDRDVAIAVRAFHEPALAELARRGTPFVGALYAGLMLTDDGPVLLEFNARFGDPEAQVLLPLVATPLAPVLLAAARGRLGDDPAAGDPAGIVADDAAAVGIVLASDGYPEAPVGGDVIRGLDAAVADGALVFHAGTERGADGAWRTRGGRAVTIVGVGPELARAREVAERAAARISFRGMRRRHDIALGAEARPIAALAEEARA
ncbi:MAG: phosphoribosylamine--glycine ligase [Chloroflexi bacterium]|nr:phosphoribosylamine--glycine ligase [Chloroflexota bacterium]